MVVTEELATCRAVQLLLGHSKIESTIRSLVIALDDALEIVEKIDILRDASESRRGLR